MRRYVVLGGEEKKWKSILAPLEKCASDSKEHVVTYPVHFVTHPSSDNAADTTAAPELKCVLESDDLVMSCKRLLAAVSVIELLRLADETSSSEAPGSPTEISFLWKPVVHDPALIADGVQLQTSVCAVLDACSHSIVCAIASLQRQQQQKRITVPESAFRVVFCNSHRGWSLTQNRIATHQALCATDFGSPAPSRSSSSSPSASGFFPSTPVPEAYILSAASSSVAPDDGNDDAPSASNGTRWILKPAAACVVSGSHDMMLLGSRKQAQALLNTTMPAATHNKNQSCWLLQRVVEPARIMIKSFCVFDTLFSMVSHVHLGARADESPNSDSSCCWIHSKSFVKACPEKSEGKQPLLLLAPLSAASGVCCAASQLIFDSESVGACAVCRRALCDDVAIQSQVRRCMLELKQSWDLHVFGVDFIVLDADSSSSSSSSSLWKIAIVDVNAFPDFSGVPREIILPRLLRR